MKNLELFKKRMSKAMSDFPAFSDKSLKERMSDAIKVFSKRAAQGDTFNHKVDMIANPALKYPRNAGCFCGSKRKAKACCIPKSAIEIESKYEKEAVRFLQSALEKVGRK